MRAQTRIPGQSMTYRITDQVKFWSDHKKEDVWGGRAAGDRRGVPQAAGALDERDEPQLLGLAPAVLQAGALLPGRHGRPGVLLELDAGKGPASGRPLRVDTLCSSTQP